jgi:hypothetical protein
MPTEIIAGNMIKYAKKPAMNQRKHHAKALLD